MPRDETDRRKDELGDIIASARMHLELERSLGADRAPFRPDRVKDLRAKRRRPVAAPARPITPALPPRREEAQRRPPPRAVPGREPVFEPAPQHAAAGFAARPGAESRKPGRAMSAAEKAAALEELRRELESCCLCEIGNSRINLVFGVGRADADLMFVGEAPGEQEDLRGLPFVGPAGQLLTKIIEAIGLTRDEVYIANVLKCRPPGNRAPLPDEAARCLPHLRRQIEIIRPRILVTLGNPATQALLETTSGISKVRGIFAERDGTLYLPTFHPAYLLRDPARKKEVWEDMKKVWAKMKELGLKVGELKQSK